MKNVILLSCLFFFAGAKIDKGKPTPVKTSTVTKKIAPQKLKGKSCSADFVFQNGTGSNVITYLSVTSNYSGGVPSTFNLSGYSLYPNDTYHVYNTVDIFNGGSFGTQATISWETAMSGCICVYQLDSGDFVHKYTIPGGSTTYTFTNTDLTCHGYLIILCNGNACP